MDNGAANFVTQRLRVLNAGCDEDITAEPAEF
jgi:hypothetical protein